MAFQSKSLLAAVITVLASASIAAADPVPCTGLIAVNAVVASDVVVPNGAYCGIDGTVLGDIYVQPYGALTVGFSATVKGDIQSDSNASWSALGRAVDVFGRVEGNVTHTGAGIFGIYAGTITGNVLLKGSNFSQFSAFGSTTRVEGNIISDASGETFVGSGFGGSITVTGHVMARSGGGTMLDNWAGTAGTSRVEKSTCGMNIANVHASSGVDGKVSASCSPRK